MGEYYFGAAFRTENFIYLSTGFGLGGGIVLDGKLLHGCRGFPSEIGHLAMDPGGEPCICRKRGFRETQVSPPHFIARLEARLHGGEGSQLSGWTSLGDDGIKLKTILLTAQQREPLASIILGELDRDLGSGIASLINVFNPQWAVLGGMLPQARELLLPKIIETVRKNTLSPSFAGARIVASSHAENACLLGDVALVLDELLRDPSLLTQHIKGD